MKVEEEMGGERVGKERGETGGNSPVNHVNRFCLNCLTKEPSELINKDSLFEQ